MQKKSAVLNTCPYSRLRTQYCSSCTVADEVYGAKWAGIVAQDNNEDLIGKNDIETQTRKVLENIRIALEAAGARAEDIVQQRLFIVDIGRHRSQIGPLLAEFYGDVNRPTSTAVGVTELMMPDALIEIEVTAVLN